MQYMQTTQTHSLTEPQEANSIVAGSFTQRFAVAVATIFSVFVASIILVDPQVARFALIWVLWAVVIVVAVGTHVVGSLVGRRSL